MRRDATWSASLSATMATRRAISDPIAITWQGNFVPPLTYVIACDHRPSGLVEELDPNHVVGHYPWFIETAIRLSKKDPTATDTWAVLYKAPLEHDRVVMLACLDQTIEGLFRLMTGADYGDGVAGLVSKHWPDLYGLLLAGQNGTEAKRFLCRIVTTGRVQWAVAFDLQEIEGDSKIEFLNELVKVALHVSLRGSDFTTELPGLIEVLGGPDRESRIFKAIGKVATQTSGTLDGFSDGIPMQDLWDLARSAKDLCDEVRGQR